MRKYIFPIIISLLLPSCANMGSIGNSESIRYTETHCSDPAAIKKIGNCMKVTDVWSLKSDSTYVETTQLTDGSVREVKIDNSGQPSFAHDLATTVQAIALKKAMADD